MKNLKPCLLAIALFVATAAGAQQTTEIYIPIGESPGVSDDESWIGDISNVDYSAMRIAVDTSSGTRSVRVDDATRYYIDRSGDRRKNVYGDMRDCRVGRRIEVYVDDDGIARWIKIRAE